MYIKLRIYSIACKVFSSKSISVSIAPYLFNTNRRPAEYPGVFLLTNGELLAILESFSYQTETRETYRGFV